MYLKTKLKQAVEGKTLKVCLEKTSRKCSLKTITWRTEAGAKSKCKKKQPKTAMFKARLVGRALLWQKNAVYEVLLNFVQYLLWSGSVPSQINRQSTVCAVVLRESKLINVSFSTVAKAYCGSREVI